MLLALGGGSVLDDKNYKLSHDTLNILLSMHLLRNVMHVADVRPLVRLRVDALRHQLPQALAVLVRRQRRVVALQGGGLGMELRRSGMELRKLGMELRG